MSGLIRRTAPHRAVGYGIALIGMIAMVTGCGGSTASSTTGSVTGMVTLNGMPIGQGEVTFEPKSGGDSKPTTAPISGGTFVSPQLTPGQYAVSVKPSAPMPGTKLNPSEPKLEIPEKYKSSSTSGLVVDVKTGNDNRLEIKMM